MSYPALAAGLIVGSVLAYLYYRYKMMQEIVHVL